MESVYNLWDALYIDLLITVFVQVKMDVLSGVYHYNCHSSTDALEPKYSFDVIAFPQD